MEFSSLICSGGSTGIGFSSLICMSGSTSIGFHMDHTCSGAVVGDEAGHVQWLSVDGEVPHAAHEVPSAHREVLREVGYAAQQQRPCQVQ